MNKAVVLFSGGIDSTYLAVRSVLSYDKLILNTYKVPGMINTAFSKKSASQVCKLYKDKIRHNIIDIREFIYSLRGGIKDCIRDNVKYGFFCSWCLGCRLSMHLFTIGFCKENNITTVLEGSNFYDSESLAQNEDVINAIRGIYEEEGIKFKTPFYYEDDLSLSKNKALLLLKRMRIFKDSTGRRVDYLKSLALDSGGGFFSTYRGVQPTCLTSICFNAPKAFLVNFRKESQEGYLKYISDKVKSWKESKK
jgi:hypothetical protein